MHIILDLLDLCRAYDALGRGTPIVSSSVATLRAVIAEAIVAECTKIAGSGPSVTQEIATDTVKSPEPVNLTPATPSETAPVKAPEAMAFEDYVNAFSKASEGRHAAAKAVLSRHGLSKARDAKPEDRAAIIAEISANG